MATLGLYRELVTEHAAVSDATVELWLGIAVKRLDAPSFGVMFPEAAVWWAAHGVQTSPGSGAPGAPVAGQVGPLVSQKDGDLSRTYAKPQSSSSGGDPEAEEMITTGYGRRYLALRNTRAAAMPTFFGPGRC